MALTDINFQEGEAQDLTASIALGTLNAPADIVIESSCSQFPVLEAPEIVDQGGGGGDIFIIND